MNRSHAFVGVLLICAPAAARAQDGFRMRPSFTATQVYESNLFAAPTGEQADLITRITPGIASEFRSATWTLQGRYTFDVERFAEHSELTTMDARRNAVAGLEYRPTRRLKFAGGSELSTTQTPGELSAVSGLVFSRARAQRIAAQGGIEGEVSRLTTGTVDYEFTRETLVGGIETRAHSLAVGAAHLSSSRNTIAITSRVSQFDFGSLDTGTAAVTSVTLTLGWTRAVARRTDVMVNGGPRVTNGALTPELSVSVRHHSDEGSLSFAYSRTQATIIGLAGTADTQSVAATAVWQPNRSLEIAATPSYVRNRHSALQADVCRLTLGASRPIRPGLSVALSATGAVQTGNLYARAVNDTIQQQNIMIKVIAQPGLHSR